MDYKKKYEQALERARHVHTTNVDENKKSAEYIFPELKESEVLKIKRDIEYAVRCAYGDNGDNTNSILAWLEKQVEQFTHEGTFVNVDDVREEFIQEIYRILDADSTNDRANQIIDTFDSLPTVEIKRPGEQKPIDKIEPKFKVGDWIVGNYISGRIAEIRDVCYLLDNRQGFLIEKQDKYHLWTIKDAKDGDVLYTSSTASHEIFIFKGLTKEGYIECYCSYDSEDKYCDGKYHFIGKPTFMTHPATKEQCDLLFQKMHEAGCEWDADKKELKKIEQKSDENIELKFKVRDTIVEKDLDEYDYETIKDIKDGQYIFTDGYSMNIDEQEGWRLVKFLKSLNRSLLWSEEDEQMINDIIEAIDKRYAVSDYNEMVTYLKSIKERMKGE